MTNNNLNSVDMELEQQLRGQLRRSEQQLGDQQLAALKSARDSALLAPSRRPRRKTLVWGGAALACSMTLALLLVPMTQTTHPPVSAAAVNYALTSDSEVIDDLDFYTWLALNDEVI